MPFSSPRHRAGPRQRRNIRKIRWHDPRNDTRRLSRPQSLQAEQVVVKFDQFCGDSGVNIVQDGSRQSVPKTPLRLSARRKVAPMGTSGRKGREPASRSRVPLACLHDGFLRQVSLIQLVNQPAFMVRLDADWDIRLRSVVILLYVRSLEDLCDLCRAINTTNLAALAET